MNVSQIFAWTATAGILLLFCMYPLKKHFIKSESDERFFVTKASKQWNTFHKILGSIVLITVLFHASFSTHGFTMYFGTLGLLLIVFHACFSQVKNRLKKPKLKTHKYFFVVLLLVLTIHIILALFV